MNEVKSPTLIVVRIKGEPNLRSDIRGALESLKLKRVHTARLLSATPDVLGTLRKLKDVIVWGEVEETTVAELLKKRAKLKGNRKLTLDFIKKNLNISDFDSLAKLIVSDSLRLKDIPGLIPYFRLSSPSRGYVLRGERTKRGKKRIAGYAGMAINDLILRMI